MKFYDLGDKIICSCPKAGSRSIQTAFLTDSKVREIMPHKVEGRVIAFIRHPITRLASCFRYFTQTDWHYDMQPQDTYEGFVDSVLNGHSNRHWDSQSKHLSHGQKFLPTEVYRFEWINDVWPTLTHHVLPTMNASDKMDLNTRYRVDDLRGFYEADLIKWQQATRETLCTAI